MRLRAFLLVALAVACLAVLAAAPVLSQQASAPFTFPMRGGKVLTTMSVGIYTYMETSAGGQTFWVVSPVCTVKAGDSIDVIEGKFYTSVFNEGLGLTIERLVVASKLAINGQEVEAFKAHDLPSGCAIRPPAKQQ